MTEISLSGRGARGESQADILRRTGQFGVLPTDTDAEAVGKLNAEAAGWAEGTLPGGAGTKSAKEWAGEAETASISTDTSQRWYLTRKQALFGQCDSEKTAQLVIFPDGTKQDFTSANSLKIGEGSIAVPDRYYLSRKEVAFGVADESLNAQFATFVDGTNSARADTATQLTGIACAGDSLTQGTGAATPYPSQLATLTGRDVANTGIGGQQGYQIAARMGALGVPVTVAGNSLSAGANTVTAINGTAPQSVLSASPAGFFNTNLQLLSTQDALTRTITGTLGSVHGTLTRTATLVSGSYTSASTETYTFTPDADATLPAKVPAGTMFVADYEYEDRAHVFWLFRNNYLDAGYLDVLDACIRRIGHGRYVILPVINGNYPNERSSSGTPDDYLAIREIEDALANRYGGRFLPLRRLLIDKALSDLSISPTAQDTTDVSDDTVPVSLRQDNIHLTDGALGFVAAELNTFLTAKGY